MGKTKKHKFFQRATMTSRPESKKVERLNLLLAWINSIYKKRGDMSSKKKALRDQPFSCR